MRKIDRFLVLLTFLIRGITISNGETDHNLQSLVETSAQRLLIADKVALAKWDSGAPVEDAPREAKVLQAAVKDGALMGLDSAQVEAFFRAQIEANKLVQYSRLADWRRKGKAPAHAPIDLVIEIRPKLDEIEKRLIAELSGTVSARSAKTCRLDVSRAVGEYLHAHKVNPDSISALALDHAMAATCIQ
jgi:chorismate mutase